MAVLYSDFHQDNLEYVKKQKNNNTNYEWADKLRNKNYQTSFKIASLTPQSINNLYINLKIFELLSSYGIKIIQIGTIECNLHSSVPLAVPPKDSGE